MYKEVIEFLDNQISLRQKELRRILSMENVNRYYYTGCFADELSDEIMLLQSVKKKYKWLQEHKL